MFVSAFKLSTKIYVFSTTQVHFPFMWTRKTDERMYFEIEDVGWLWLYCIVWFARTLAFVWMVNNKTMVKEKTITSFTIIVEKNKWTNWIHLARTSTIIWDEFSKRAWWERTTRIMCITSLFHSFIRVH